MLGLVAVILSAASTAVSLSTETISSNTPSAFQRPRSTRASFSRERRRVKTHKKIITTTSKTTTKKSPRSQRKKKK